ncbi:MAG: radical SAM protein [Candidatus Caldatribacterium sp.]|nr:radical SAM protein [Candidatus Caldatribacterium sp.]
MGSLDFQWHVTNRCNLRCRHCYQETFQDEDSGTFFAVARRLLEGLERLGRLSILNITGGEPLLLGEDLFALFGMLSEHPRILELGLITNALCIDEKVLARLAAFPKLTTVKVSLEGMEGMNDAIRGKGVFRRVTRALELLSRSPLRVVLMVTLHKKNLSEVPELFRFAQEIGVDGIIFERFVPEGIGRGMAEAVLGSREWQEFLKVLCELCKMEVPLSSLLPYKAFWVEFGDGVGLLGAPCSLGESFCLMPDGTLFPCRRLPIPLGNVLREELENLIAHPLVLRLRDRRYLEGKCRVCTVEGCLGCRALAYTVSGNPFGEDIQCFLQEVRISTTSLS